jgi:hypothetical protein
MKCNECGSEWKTDSSRSSSLTVCPFCQERLIAEKTAEWKYFDNSKELFEYIATEYGNDALFRRKYLADHTAPLMAQGQKNLVKQAFDCGAVKILHDNMASEGKGKEIAVKQAVGKLIDLMFSQEAAERVIWEFTNAIGWGMAEPMSNISTPLPNSNSQLQSRAYALSQPSAPSVAVLMTRAWQFAEDSDWKDATDYFNRALDIDPLYAPAFFGLLCVELKVSEKDKLSNIKSSNIITRHKYYKRAITDPAIKAQLNHYIQTINARIAVEKEAMQAEAEIGKVPRIGSTYSFAGYDWRVLDVKNNRALLISEKVLEERPYHRPGGEITWEQCTLRKYLNEEFYNKLGVAKSAIVETRINNPKNQWYDTMGGNATIDKLFLLSLDELVKFFGDSGDLLNKRRKNCYGKVKNDGRFIVDSYDSARIAKDGRGRVLKWWLRSPGLNSSHAANVNLNGSVSVSGVDVDVDFDLDYGLDFDKFFYCGVRPALWLNL